ncbi:MAG: SpoVG family protein [Clostridiales Family XIII bacterium]|jgi:stage V sporulation protein G|nr:SpoVG family protein [Clostridiales Family XIII bacterium]
MAQEQNTAATKIEARAYPIKNPGKGSNMLAYASIIIDDKFAVSGLRVLAGEKGLFVSMPQTRDNTGKWRDICNPIIPELRGQINEKVLDEFAAAIDALANERESTVARLRDAAKTAKERPAAPPKDKAVKKSEPEL